MKFNIASRLSTGMRAVDHAAGKSSPCHLTVVGTHDFPNAENLYRPNMPYPLKVLAYDALASLFTNLPLSKASPSDVLIRQKLQVASWMSLWPLKMDKYAPLGLSHSLGHRLGAKYGIPHGITSCLTLAPVVALQARVASPEHKKALSRALFYLKIASTGDDEEDIQLLAHAIEHLVIELGLKSDLKAYNVPREDLSKIAEGALGGATGEGKEDPRFEGVVKILEGLHSD